MSRWPAAPLAPAAPGVVILGPDLAVLAATPQAEHWLSLVVAEPHGALPLPVAVYTVAARLNAIDRDGVPAGAVPTVRVPTRTGAWLLVHATRLVGAGDDGAVAVVVEPAPPGDTAPLLFSARGLTAREEAVAALVLRGASTRQIAAELHISPHTVQDHLKSVFDKVGVRSRRDLVGQVLATGGTGRGR